MTKDEQSAYVASAFQAAIRDVEKLPPNAEQVRDLLAKVVADRARDWQAAGHEVVEHGVRVEGDDVCGFIDVRFNGEPIERIAFTVGADDPAFAAG